MEATPPEVTDPDDPDNTITQDPVKDEDEEKVPTKHRQALKLEKTSDKAEIVKAGQEITYKFVVTNTGNVTLDNVEIDDEMLADAGINVTLEKTTLNPGEATIGYATYTVTQKDMDDETKILNTATVTGTPPSYDPENPATDPNDPGYPPVSPPAEDDVPVVKNPDIEIFKTANKVTVTEAGEEINYTFTVTNTGNVTLTDVVVKDEKLGGEIELEKSALAPGETTTGTATYQVTQAEIDDGEVYNIATATGFPPGYDKENPPTEPSDPSYPIVDEGEEIVPVKQTPGINIVKTSDKEEVDTVGETITYTFEITNTGNVTLTDVKVTDNMLENAGIDVTLAKTTLAPGESTTATAAYQVTQADRDNTLITNVAKVTGTPPGYDPKDPNSPEMPVDEDEVSTKAFNIVDLVLVADPEVIIADGKSTSTLTTTITDKDGNPVPNVEVVFEADKGTFPNGKTATTDKDGKASVLFQSDKIESTESQKVPVKATVYDPERGLKGQDEITMIFEPASIIGVVTDNNTGKPVEGAKIVVTDPDTGFESEYITGKDGAYKIPIPRGEVTYDVEITKEVVINNTPQEVTFKQKAKPGKVDPAIVDEEFPAVETFVGIIKMKDKGGTEKLITPSSGERIIIKGISENGRDKIGEINESGVFTVEELEVGKEYRFAVIQEVDGQELLMGNITVTLDEDGEIRIHEELIDPYGTITEKGSEGKVIIGGAKVELRYADTERNRSNGRTPHELVQLPILPGFAPNDNANHQFSSYTSVWNDDTLDYGNYAWMVFPETDYYIVATHPDYQDYISGILSVEYDILKHDFEMEKLTEPEEPEEEDKETPLPPKDETKPTSPNVTITKEKVEEKQAGKRLPSTATNMYNTLAAGGLLILIGFTTILVHKRRRRN